MPFPPDAPDLPDARSLTNVSIFRGITLLVVEDSRFTCDSMRLICLRAGGRLRRAETLAAARAHLACYRPDVVIVDLGLPDGRGEGLIADLAARGIPVLGTSGDPDGHDLAIAAGAAGFVDKPMGGIAAFRSLVLRVLGTGVSDVPAENADGWSDSPFGDPLAFRDDLARAASLISGDQRDYALGFLRNLGRAAGDGALEAAAAGAVSDPDRTVLARLLAERLAVTQSMA